MNHKCLAEIKACELGIKLMGALYLFIFEETLSVCVIDLVNAYLYGFIIALLVVLGRMEAKEDALQCECARARIIIVFKF